MVQSDNILGKIIFSCAGHTVGLFEPIYTSQHLDLQWGYFLLSKVFPRNHECLPCSQEVDGAPRRLLPEQEDRSAYRSEVTESHSQEERMEICQGHKRETREMRERANRKVGNTPVCGQDSGGPGN